MGHTGTVDGLSSDEVIGAIEYQGRLRDGVVQPGIIHAHHRRAHVHIRVQ